MGSRSRNVSSQGLGGRDAPGEGDARVTSPPFDHAACDCASAAANIASVKAEPKRAPVAELRQAVEIALTGDWQAAHLIAQKYEDDDVASWIHAVVHRMEGDLANARYWYRRVGRELRDDVTTQDELHEIGVLLADR